MVIKIMQGQSAGGAARWGYFQCQSFFPAAIAYPAILMPCNRGGADEAFFRINQVQKTVEQSSSVRYRHISDCGKARFWCHRRPADQAGKTTVPTIPSPEDPCTGYKAVPKALLPAFWAELHSRNWRRFHRTYPRCAQALRGSGEGSADPRNFCRT